MEKPQRSVGQFFRSAAIIAVSFFLIAFAFRLVEAGSLSPSVATTVATMNTSSSSYNALVGTFNSTSITKDLNGSALEISRCIIDQITGGSCP